MATSHDPLCPVAHLYYRGPGCQCDLIARVEKREGKYWTELADAAIGHARRDSYNNALRDAVEAVKGVSATTLDGRANDEQVYMTTVFMSVDAMITAIEALDSQPIPHGS